MYDVVVVGARCAGALTALLLARRGHSVALVDRAAVATDPLCTHYLAPAGVAVLAATGLLDAVHATGCPAAQRTVVHAGAATLEIPGVTYAPRRSVLDALLADEAAAAGAEVRQGFTVTDLVWDAERIAGIVGHGADGRSVVEEAAVVVGADGRHSLVAETVGAEPYLERPATSCCYYAYWAGIPAGGPELHLGQAGAVGVFPTNDDLACVVVTRPIRDWITFKRDPEATYMGAVERVAGLAGRLGEASRQSRFFGSADLTGCFRRASGAGWALVGDAGLHRDPILGGGMADALVQAALLSRALDNGRRGVAPFDRVLAEYQHRRDEVWLPLYEAAGALAAFAWSPTEVPRLVHDLLASTSPAMALAAGGTGDLCRP